MPTHCYMSSNDDGENSDRTLILPDILNAEVRTAGGAQLGFTGLLLTGPQYRCSLHRTSEEEDTQSVRE